MEYHIKDKTLKSQGKLKIEWAEHNMPVLRKIREDFKKTKPLKGLCIGACLHITTETANLAITLKAGGAEAYLTASNPLSTQDDVAAALALEYHIPVFAIKGEDNKTYYQHIEEVLKRKPVITMDDGADLISNLHRKYPKRAKDVIGGTEETTTGVIRLRSMAKDGVLKYPVIAVNDSQTKHLFDNRYGTGQSTIDGILRATNVLIAGMKVVVGGYGWCGRGIAMRAKGMGGRVIITETDPVRALEAVMDGFDVMPMGEAAGIGDLFITSTGDRDILAKKHFLRMKDGAIIANAGHFNVEIDIPGLKEISTRKKRIRPYVDQYTLKNGKKINLLAEGRLVNLSAAEGHPAMVMDMSFANQALAAKYLKEKGKGLKGEVYTIPEDIDKEIAVLKLKTMGIETDKLTKAQKKYLSSWEEGT